MTFKQAGAPKCSCLTACGGDGKGNPEAPDSAASGASSTTETETNQNTAGTEEKNVTETVTAAAETETAAESIEPVETDHEETPKSRSERQPTAPPVEVKLGTFSVNQQKFTVSPDGRSNLRDSVELTNLKPQNGIRENFNEGYGDDGFLFKGDIFVDEDTRWQEFTFDNVAIFTLQGNIAVGDMDGGGGIVYSAIDGREYTICLFLNAHISCRECRFCGGSKMQIKQKTPPYL